MLPSTSGRKYTGRCCWLVGHVADAEQQLGVGALAQLAEVVDAAPARRATGGGVRDARGGLAAHDRGARDAAGRSDRGPSRPRRRRRGVLPAVLAAEAQLGDLDAGAFGLARGPAARVRRTGTREPAGAGLGDAAAGDARVEVRRHPSRRRRPWLSDSSAIRSAMRRLVLARRLSLITPAGRCVARIRWMPSERPRWAMSTTPSTNSGTSPTRAANSSMTITSAGGRLGVAALLELEQVLGLLAVEQVLAVAQLGAQAGERAAHEVRAEVGDQADAVRQGHAVGEGGAALVVDEEEGDAVGAVLGRHAEHPGLQELALARAGGAADERVRSLGAQVEVHRRRRPTADDARAAFRRVA